MINLRQATSKDIPWMLDEGKKFLSLMSETKNYYNRDHLSGVLNFILKEGIMYVTEDEGKLVGAIGGMIVPNVFNGDIKDLGELFWWVPEDYRNTRSGYLLMREFTKYGENAGVDNVVFSSMEFSPINEDAMTKRGFKKKETAYVMEVN
ncbi:MAG: GNAT family N-acetyltransferase [Candidatus Peribacteraceae bacterium]|nr:GNAT family N-acetyltransferase [Candidatus Peribacteraceae bacterium]